MKHLTDILESLLDNKDEIIDRFEKVAKEPHIALNRDCNNYDDALKSVVK